MGRVGTKVCHTQSFHTTRTIRTALKWLCLKQCMGDNVGHHYIEVKIEKAKYSVWIF
jgi:hypothetical protein